MPQAGGQGEARKQQPSSSMPRFKGSRSTDTVHARDIQSRLRMAFGASQPVSDSRFFAGRQDTLALLIAALEGEGAPVVICGGRSDESRAGTERVTRCVRGWRTSSKKK